MTAVACSQECRNKTKVSRIDPPQITIMVLNWNGKEDTIRCIDSLKRLVYSHYSIIVVGASTSVASVFALVKGKVVARSHGTEGIGVLSQFMSFQNLTTSKHFGLVVMDFRCRAIRNMAIGTTMSHKSERLIL